MKPDPTETRPPSTWASLQLGDVERRVMSVVYFWIRVHELVPTHREIARVVFGGKGAGPEMVKALRRLEVRGLIERDCRGGVCVPRAIRLTPLGLAWSPVVSIDLGTAKAIPSIGLGPKKG